jgi:pimeloyl-ACP methyl ester carboxylesterase
MKSTRLLVRTIVTAALLLRGQDASSASFYPLTIVAESGSGPNFASFAKGPSINAAGYVAFVGRFPRSDGRTVENIYAWNPETQVVQGLMNDIFVLPPAGSPPRQSFGPVVQINNQGQVIARRFLEAVVQQITLVVFPPFFGEELTAPLTYLESWPVTGNISTPGRVGLPDRQYVMGDAGIGLAGPILTLPNLRLGSYFYFINPVTAGVYPSAFDQSGGFPGIFPYFSFNNYGQEVFAALANSGNKLVTEPFYKYYYGASTPNYVSQPMMADNGLFVLRVGPDPTAGIVTSTYTFNAFRTIAASATGFPMTGLPGISDDGAVVAFVGRESSQGTPGIYASVLNVPSDPASPRFLLRLVGGDSGQNPADSDLGTNSVGSHFFFNSFDFESRASALHASRGTNGIIDDEIVVSFIGTPNASGRVNLSSKVMNVFPNRGVWTVRGRIKAAANQGGFVFQRDELLPVLQIGEGTAASGGATVTDVAIHDSLANNGSITGADSLSKNRVVLWGATATSEFIVQATAASTTLEALDAKPPFVSALQFPVPAIDAGSLQKLNSAKDQRIGAVADGVTKILLRFRSGSPGSVTFLTSNGVPTEQLTTIDSPTTPAVNVSTIGLESLYPNASDPGHVALALYTVPDGLPPASLTGYPMHLLSVFTPADGGPQVTNVLAFELRRPPVLLVHGLWADPTKWIAPTPDTCLPALETPSTFQTLRNNNYKVYVVDYRHSNAAPFARNQVVLWKPIQKAISNSERDGIAITQVDVVGHSMGGIITRYFAQAEIFRKDDRNYGKGYIRRFITMGTPHLGSGLARMNAEMAQAHPWCAASVAYVMARIKCPVDGGAIEDLNPGSPALNLMEQTPIPSHAIASATSPGDYYFWPCIFQVSVLNPLGDASYFNPTGVRCAIPIYNYDSVPSLVDSVFSLQENDRVVSISSQYGGLSGSYVTRIVGPNHTDEPSSQVVADRVLELLASPKGNNFAESFPAAGPLMPHQPAAIHAAGKGFARVSTPPLLVIVSPTNGQAVEAGSTITISIEPAPGTLASAAYLLYGRGDLLNDLVTTNLPFSLNIPIPSTYHGDFPVTVVGKDAGGNISLESITTTVTVTTTSLLQRLVLDATNLVIEEAGLEQPLKVLGEFADGLTRDITAPVHGTRYFSSQPSVATVNSNGVIIALANGTTTIAITNGTASAQVTVQVSLLQPRIMYTVANTAQPNAAIVHVTVWGLYLSGASVVEVLQNGVVDTNILATNVVLDASGSILTADLLVSPAAIYGPRSIRVTTPGGVSVSQLGDGNLFYAGFARLQVEQLQGQVRLAWPMALTNWFLQESDSVGLTANWIPLSNSPAITGASRVVTNAVSGETKFYRLSQ